VNSSNPGSTPSPTLERIGEIVEELLDLDGMPLTAETRPRDVPGWDSLANVNIVFAVEEEFGVEFEDDQLKRFATLGDFARGVDAAREEGV
jgi:acyl carrier protein